jgi:hypothetical protein
MSKQERQEAEAAGEAKGTRERSSILYTKHLYWRTYKINYMPSGKLALKEDSSG